MVLIASTLPKLQELVDGVNEESKKYGLSLNAGKTNVMMEVLRQAADEIEKVTQFTCLGAKFANTYDDTPEIRRRIAIVKQATMSLTNIWKDRHIALRAKRRLPSSLVFSIAGYGAESWTMKE